MELTAKQLKIVEHYLNIKDITYIDIRMEVFDHIVSDIEAKMVTENLDFETAFKNVKYKWSKHFRDSSSLYFGVMYSAPKIVIEKAKKSFSSLFFIGTFSMFFILISIDNFQFIFSENLQNTINFLFKSVSVLCLFCLLFIYYKNSKIDQKSTHSFILKTQFLTVFFSLLPILIPSYFTNEDSLDSFYVLMLFVSILSTFTCCIFFKKHKETIKKYKIY